MPTNIGAAFPLEKLSSDIARNSFNYQAILNGLIAWDKTTEDTVTIRLTKDTDPYYEDYVIPSKSAVFDLNAVICDVSGVVPANSFAIHCTLNSALYGGSYLFESQVFDASSASVVNVSTNRITLPNASAFSTLNRVVFHTNGETMPGGMDENKQYVVRSKSGNALNFYEADGVTKVDITAVGSGDITIINLDNPTADSTDSGDIATVRISVVDAGNANWELNYFQKIYTWESGGTYRYGSLVSHNNVLYRVLTNISGLTETPVVDAANYELAIKPWAQGTAVNIGELISYNNVLYRAIVSIPAATDVTNDREYSEITPDYGVNEKLYELYAPEYVSGGNYNYGGEYVFYEGSPYVAKQKIVNSEIAPPNDSGNWELAVILPVPVSGNIKESTIIKWYVDVDVTKLVMKNKDLEDPPLPSEPSTNINLRLTIKTKDPASIYQKSVDILSTSNYAFWPNDLTTMWDVAKKIVNGNDASKDISERQDYSAVMVFDHSNASIAKTVNFLNYDGPDLDQGLCVYLPVEVPVGESAIATPEDGFTYEFFFRIWPNTELTDDLTRDHIINKSHIYVYSAPTLEDVQNNTCGNPIAKFSMARVTNFYVFGENIAIPDKPVCYRATFIYSEMENKWMTLDYYQLPDHIFMGPIGFIDPNNPANLDINNSVIGDINPNAANVGYETGAFPLFQDPFSNPDLTPFRITDNAAYDLFRNRIS